MTKRDADAFVIDAEEPKPTDLKGLATSLITGKKWGERRRFVAQTPKGLKLFGQPVCTYLEYVLVHRSQHSDGSHAVGILILDEDQNRAQLHDRHLLPVAGL
jgi:hypothetical protein